MTRAKYIFFGQIYKFIINCNGKMICKLYKYIQILFKNARKNLLAIISCTCNVSEFYNGHKMSFTK